MVEITWPQFKHAHSGLENEEISKRWKRFKEGKYHMGDVKNSQATEEVPRDQGEVEELSQIQPITLETDNSSLQSVDEAKSEGEEGKDSPSSEPIVVEEEQIEAPLVEETPSEVEIPAEPITQPQNKPNKDNLAERLRNSIIYDI